jgi:IclR family acetate operon transcriptional repressor
MRSSAGGENLSTASKRQDRSAGRTGAYYSQAVGRALEALEFLKTAPEPISLQEVTAAIGGAKPSIFRLLHTLEAHGYVTRDQAGSYMLSPDVRTTIPSQFVAPLIHASQPVIHRLAREFRETASVAALFDNHIEVIAVAESPQLIRMVNTVGRIIQPHASSLGKSIAAHQTEERRERLLRSYGIYRYTPKTITDELELRAELDRVRARGYAIEREETTSQGCCFGVPILGEDGYAFAAISLAMPIMRLQSDEEETRMIQGLKDASRAIREMLNLPSGRSR